MQVYYTYFGQENKGCSSSGCSMYLLLSGRSALSATTNQSIAKAIYFKRSEVRVSDGKPV